MKSRFNANAYSKLAAAALVGVPLSGYSQVVYTDLDPDVTVSGYIGPAEYRIDMDGDAVDDIDIVADYIATYNQYCGVLGFRSVELAGKFKPEAFSCGFGEGRRSPFRADADRKIDGDNLQWIRRGHLNRWTSGPCSMGFWQGGQDGFMGLRIPVPGGYRYGWVRLDVLNRYSVRVLDYALQLTANKTIRAGESPDCPLPASLIWTPAGSGADLSWSGSPDHVEYAVELIRASDGESRTFVTGTTSVSLGTVDTSDTYSWGVRASCTGGLISSTADGGSVSPLRVSTPASENLEVMPNPASSEVTIRVNQESRLITVADLYGRVLESCASCTSLTIDVGSWPAGVYFVRSDATVERLQVLK